MTLNVIPQVNPLRMKRMIEELKQKGISDTRVLNAMMVIPREQFLPRALWIEAYDDKALPIGENQTISMPSVVAKMTELLQLNGTQKVLEIGTGCGYQASVLSKLSRRVFSVERFPSLSHAATKRLESLGFRNVITIVGDGTLGWPAQAPFDRIIVTAAAPSVPQALLDQLAPNGIMIIPVGATEVCQNIVCCMKNEKGDLSQTVLEPVVFVPLIGAQGIKEKRSA